MELECANCGRLDGPRQNQMGVTVCEDCAWALGGNVFGGLEARAEKAEAALAQAERERDEEESRFQSGRALIRHQENTIRSLAGQVASLQPGAKDCALRVRAERAEKALKRAREERDEARAQAVWAEQDAWGAWMAFAPNLVLSEGAWGDDLGHADLFHTEDEALAAGRAVPWWEVKA